MQIPTRPLAVIAVGGHAFESGQHPNSVEDLYSTFDALAETLMTLVQRDYNIVITHGNGPQVGRALYQAELARHEVKPMPLDVLVAETEGSLGYLLQQALLNTLRAREIRRYVVTVICQVVVDGKDEAFQKPSKPVGEFLTEAVAKGREVEFGWIIQQRQGGWRRVVPSPDPKRIIQKDMIREAALQGHIVVACGGGGIPVIKDANGDYQGVEAVIDKDLTSSNLATAIGAELMIILTTVPNVFVDFGTDDQRPLSAVTVEQVEALIGENQFPPGSMGPKVEAMRRFLAAGGRRGLITDAATLEAALAGRGGTHFVGKL